MCVRFRLTSSLCHWQQLPNTGNSTRYAPLRYCGSFALSMRLVYYRLACTRPPVSRFSTLKDHDSRTLIASDQTALGSIHISAWRGCNTELRAELLVSSQLLGDILCSLMLWMLFQWVTILRMFLIPAWRLSVETYMFAVRAIVFGFGKGPPLWCDHEGNHVLVSVKFNIFCD